MTHRDVLYDATLHTPTPAENRIEQGLSDAFDIDVSIRCLSRGELRYRTWPFEQDANEQGLAFIHPPYSIIWLSQAACDGVMKYVEDPQKDTAFTRINEVKGLRAAAHEASHYDLSFWSESAVECYAVQRVGSLAVAFGGTVDDASSMQHRAGTLVGRNQDHLSSNYEIQDCYDGGPYDLDLTRKGIFPQEPPHD